MVETTPSDGALTGQLEESSYKASRRVRTRAAMIGLAISMGATSFLVTRQSDNAMAAESVGSQKATSSIPAAPDKEVDFAPVRLRNLTVSNTSKPETSAKAVNLGKSTLFGGSGVKGNVASRLSSFKKVQKASRLRAATQKLSVNKHVTKNISSATVNSSNSGAAAVKDVTGANSQLRAQQKFAFNRLQQKSNRLKASLAKLRTESGKQQPVARNFMVSANANYKTVNVSSVGQSGNAKDAKDAKSTALISKLKQNNVASISNAPYVVSSSNSFAKTYKVKSGDTLADIANSNGISVSELATVNKLDNPNKLQVNQQLVVPANKNNNLTSETSVVLHPKFAELRNKTQAQTSLVKKIAQKQQAESSVSQGVGGENPKSSPEMRVARNQTAPTRVGKNDERLRSLKAEIEQLRRKFRAQQSGNRSEKPNSINRSINSSVTVPTRSTQRKNTSVKIDVPKSSQEAKNSAISIPVPRAATSTYSARPVAPRYSIPLPVNRNPGSTGLSRGNRAISTPLPPLAAVDRYLPKVIKENQTKTSDGFIWPAKGTLTSGYGWRWGRMHKGIDIAAPTGTPINAVGDGVVVSAGWNRGGYGYLVEIRHSNNILTRYAHNSKILVKKGQTVQQGQRISLMGSTGFSTGPHLHFEIRPNGKAKNPIAFLPKRRK
ncbi:MAG: peptidoglycan DD-metalloendopeptidase family protein [Cyanobacteria bacterium P01_A01_bin.45]